MNNLLTIPIQSVIELSSERAVSVARAILRAECGYAKLSPSALTISSRLTIADGGIDAEIRVPTGTEIPSDCIFIPGLTGYQIKSGTSFKPWTESSIRKELLNDRNELQPEVARLCQRGGNYTIISTGHDLTSEQRNDSRELIVETFAEVGVQMCENKVEVLGASQISEFAERYPGTASLLAPDPIQEGLTLDEWKLDSHMSNVFESSEEQSQMITQIREILHGDSKHIRVLGEPGLGKTRIVLESLKDESISSYVLYIRHGSLFGQTGLFRQLIKTGRNKPLILVIDELPESELSDIWNHLKTRCGKMKIVSMDHGNDETHDDEIIRLGAPRLQDETIKKILARQVGESPSLDRWVDICEGSPRVALAVAGNLRANPDDILKSPTSVPIWTRFLHSYGGRDEFATRQVDCVTQHLALFNRFGYEAPVGNEAEYIADLISRADPTIGWARFQEIVQTLRSRRILQGSRTLFFVPKALHIYLWRQYWDNYGRGFDFKRIFEEMPESLHVWFLNMFKYAGDTATKHVIDDIFRSDGIFSNRELLISEKGSRFLATLAEANSSAVLRLLEKTIGEWTDQELQSFRKNRQNVVWALEKIAVWSHLTVKAIGILARLAVNENSDYVNNSSGTLVGLFRIGPEAAATESTPETRLPAMIKLLQASNDAERRLGLKAMGAALDDHVMGFRIIGPEYQGIKERAKLWMPKTYGEWWQAKLAYFETLVQETKNWPSSLRGEVCEVLLKAVECQIETPSCTEFAFEVLEILVGDNAMLPEILNGFFARWRENETKDCPEILNRIQRIDRCHTRRSMVTRFQRYVIDVDWVEWDEDFRERHQKPKSRARDLVRALANRVARNPEKLGQIRHLLAPEGNVAALWYFGEQLAANDDERMLLPILTEIALETNHQVCLHGYLSEIKNGDSEFYFSFLKELLSKRDSAGLGVTIALRSNYDDELFVCCLDALKKKWIEPILFVVLQFGRAIESIPPKRAGRLFLLLSELNTPESLSLLVSLLDSVPFNTESGFSPGFVFEVMQRTIPGESNRDVMKGYHWKRVCLKLIVWEPLHTFPLFDAVLTRMGEVFRLSYDSDVATLANELVEKNPSEAWEIVKTHFEQELPKWRTDLLHWLKGEVHIFEEKEQRGAIADLPISEILRWIDEDIDERANLIAHAVPATLDDEYGGQLTRELLSRYGHLDDVWQGISATFHTEGWRGPASEHYRRKRGKLRRWLASGFESKITKWIEIEIECIDRRIEEEEIKEERSRFD